VIVLGDVQLVHVHLLVEPRLQPGGASTFQ
jgi:hypothetical protein